MGNLVAEDRVVTKALSFRLLAIPALWSTFVALWRKQCQRNESSRMGNGNGNGKGRNK